VLVLLLALALADEPAEVNPADDPAIMAEYYRLHDEMQKLAKRQVWGGVGRYYAEMEALGVPMTYDDYVAGALAARNEGEVMLAYDRLQAAARIDGTREVIEWLWSIDTAYGRVTLATVPLEESTLQVAQLPMLPDQRAAVEAAIRQVEATGAYDGMLPEGEYTFAGQSFTVTPGPKAVSITVTVNEDEGRRKR
jgi:hypothetical protein